MIGLVNLIEQCVNMTCDIGKGGEQGGGVCGRGNTKSIIKALHEEMSGEIIAFL